MLWEKLGSIKEAWPAVSLLVILGLILGFWQGKQAGNQLATDPGVADTVWVTDTLQLDTLKVTLPAHVESIPYPIYLPATQETIWLASEKASVDTSFKQGDLSVTYWTAPRKFDISWYPAPIPIKYKHVYHTHTIELSKDHFYQALGGIGYSNQNRLYASVGIRVGGYGAWYSQSFDKEWRIGLYKEVFGFSLGAGPD